MFFDFADRLAPYNISNNPASLSLNDLSASRLFELSYPIDYVLGSNSIGMGTTPGRAGVLSSDVQTAFEKFFRFNSSNSRLEALLYNSSGNLTSYDPLSIKLVAFCVL